MKIAQKTPKVSIGLPVYNGEKFLKAAIESILSQTYPNFELIISDNASTDATETICREYAMRDERVCYHRSTVNRGAAWNFNRVFELSSGEYFRWASHDDTCEPTLLEKCVEVMERNKHTVVLCYSKTRIVDSDGSFLWDDKQNLEIRGSSPHKRLRHLILNVGMAGNPVHGLINAKALKKTLGMGGYPSSDHVLLAELSLLGEFREVPEILFYRRLHKDASRRTNYAARDAAEWYKPGSGNGIVLEYWTLFHQHLRAIKQSPITFNDKVKSFFTFMPVWMRVWHKRLLSDLRTAGERLPGFLGRAFKKYPEYIWALQLRRFRKDIHSFIPKGTTFILVDEGCFGTEAFTSRRTIPFLERNGVYWGVPSNDETAIRELERMRQSETDYLVFGWPTFWWFDHYAQFNKYLRMKFRCIKENKRLVVFDLRSAK